MNVHKHKRHGFFLTVLITLTTFSQQEEKNNDRTRERTREKNKFTISIYFFLELSSCGDIHTYKAAVVVVKTEANGNEET